MLKIKKLGNSFLFEREESPSQSYQIVPNDVKLVYSPDDKSVQFHVGGHPLFLTSFLFTGINKIGSETDAYADKADFQAGMGADFFSVGDNGSGNAISGASGTALVTQSNTFIYEVAHGLGVRSNLVVTVGNKLGQVGLQTNGLTVSAMNFMNTDTHSYFGVYADYAIPLPVGGAFNWIATEDKKVYDLTAGLFYFDDNTLERSFPLVWNVVPTIPNLATQARITVIKNGDEADTIFAPLSQLANGSFRINVDGIDGDAYYFIVTKFLDSNNDQVGDSVFLTSNPQRVTG